MFSHKHLSSTTPTTQGPGSTTDHFMFVLVGVWYRNDSVGFYQGQAQVETLKNGTGPIVVGYFAHYLAQYGFKGDISRKINFFSL